MVGYGPYGDYIVRDPTGIVEILHGGVGGDVELGARTSKQILCVCV